MSRHTIPTGDLRSQQQELRAYCMMGAEGTIPACMELLHVRKCVLMMHDDVLQPAQPLQAVSHLVRMSYSTRRPACSARVAASPTANHCAWPSCGVRLLAGPATAQSSSEHSHPPCAAQMSFMSDPG